MATLGPLPLNTPPNLTFRPKPTRTCHPRISRSSTSCCPIATVSWYDTRLYDKRVQPAFFHVRLSRFVHISSCVNEAAKRNIFISQFRRLQRVITDVHNFINEVARLMVALWQQGYPRFRLERMCSLQCLLWPQLFLVERRNGLRLYDRILDSFRRFLPRTYWPKPHPHPAP